MVNGLQFRRRIAQTFHAGIDNILRKHPDLVSQIERLDLRGGSAMLADCLEFSSLSVFTRSSGTYYTFNIREPL